MVALSPLANRVTGVTFPGNTPIVLTLCSAPATLPGYRQSSVFLHVASRAERPYLGRRPAARSGAYYPGATHTEPPEVIDAGNTQQVHGLEQA
jgi:hypothetical protein